MSFYNGINLVGDSTTLDTVFGGVNEKTTTLVNESKIELGFSINNLADATASQSCPSAPVTSGFTFPDSKSVQYTDPNYGTVIVRCADDVNNFERILQLNPSVRPSTNFDTSYGEPGGFGSANPFQNWYRGDIPALGYSGRQAQYLTPCANLTPSDYDVNLQSDVDNGVYGVHFTYQFTSPVNFSSVQFFLNSGTVSIPVFTPRWVFFFGSNDGTTWTMFNEPQNYDYPFPDDSFNFVVVNNLQHTYTFTPYNESYTYYRFVVASAGTGYFYLSSVQWNSSGQFSSSAVATNSLTNVTVGTTNKQLNLQFNDLRFNGTTFNNILLSSPDFGTTATATVDIGNASQVLNLAGSTVNVNGTPIGAQTLTVALSDETSTLTTSNQVNVRCPFSLSIKSTALPYFWVNTLPTATTPITFDILKNGTSIYSVRPTVSSTATNNASANGTLVTSPTTFAVGDLMVIRVHAVGSGSPSGAKVHIYNT